MIAIDRVRIRFGWLVMVVLAVGLAACGDRGPRGDFRSVPDQPRETSVNPSEAARMINRFRLSRGRPPLTVDPTLNRIAAETAAVLAARDQLRTELHSQGGLERRLQEANFPHVAAAENLGAGYPTLELAVAGWRNSRGHRRNLLNANVDRMGIGLALTNRGRYRSYWVLILARRAPAEGS